MRKFSSNSHVFFKKKYGDVFIISLTLVEKFFGNMKFDRRWRLFQILLALETWLSVCPSVLVYAFHAPDSIFCRSLAPSNGGGRLAPFTG